MELDRNRRLLKEHVKLTLEHVGNTYEKWPAYQTIRERVLEQLRLGGDPNMHLEDKEAQLTDYEITISIAAYYLGLQDGYRHAKALDDSSFVQKILDLLVEMQ